MNTQPTWPRCNICGLELIPGHTWSESPTAERDRLRAEKAELVATLQLVMDNYCTNDDCDSVECVAARAALAKATATEGGANIAPCDDAEFGMKP